jgi:hypothetical protein
MLHGIATAPSLGAASVQAPRARAVRCACARCGAHTVTTVGFVVAGNCSNCGSYELVPVRSERPQPDRPARLAPL